MPYGFVVNSDACSGCKTCQVACKDRNDLPAGVHWRRVIEVTAGGWEKKAGVWTTDVIAYHVSSACFHCADPVCLEPCTPEAIWRRDDGIVLIDQTLCTVCRKCEAHCPYGAIRFDPARNRVGKCDACVSEVEAGRPPACVAACPNRALAFGELSELKAKHGSVNQVFPLPDPAISRPALVLIPHRRAAQAAERNPKIVNWEEL